MKPNIPTILSHKQKKYYAFTATSEREMNRMISSSSRHQGYVLFVEVWKFSEYFH